MKSVLRWLPDVLLLAGLALYVLAGAGSVPFHGDESTLIYMSRDYYYAVQTRDIEAVEFHDPPYDAAMQELRIINGTVAKFTIGFAWDMAGLTVHDLNEQWVWEWTWDQNQALGHMPSDRLLRISRWPSTVFTALTVLLIYGITRLVSNSRLAAWVASIFYATQPAVLINGRRAVMEGSLMFFSVLVVLLAIVVSLTIHRHQKRALAWMGALGLAAGCALASKHNAALTVAAAFVAVLLHPLVACRSNSDRLLRTLSYRAAALTFAGILALLTFLALNPTWWSDPAGMPGRVWDARNGLLDAQVAFYGGYDGPADRVQALLDQTFFAGPQYYEVESWRGDLQDDIRAYQRSGLAGRDGSLLDRAGLLPREDALLGWGVLIVVLFSFGLVGCAVRFRQPTAWVVLAWFVLTWFGLLVLIPLDWQRYYLPVQAPLAVIAGVGAGQIGAWVKGWGTHG